MTAAKPFEISKRLIWDAFQKVKANKGAPGIDGESIEDFERDLKDNLYKLWNRMASGSYHPPPVKGVPIPKKSGGTRMLGVPTVADRIAQTAAKMMLEPGLENIFHNDSYGYRPGRSAHDAISVTRRRCWKYDWVVEFDVKGLFDNIDHELLMRALKRHCDTTWILLYVQRWLTAPIVTETGEIAARSRGTPQGGVVSPVLANLFLHYAFDAWVERTMPRVPFCRYADDGLLHCKSKAQAEYVLAMVRGRFRDCGLELNEGKTRIVYCKDVNRSGDHPVISFDFLGFTFRPRRSFDKHGRRYVNFSPAVSRTALKEIGKEIRSWHMQLKNDKSIDDLSNMCGPILRGWQAYYGRFYASALGPIWKRFNWYLAQWVRRKHKRYANHNRRARMYIRRLAEKRPHLFIHWKLATYDCGR